MTPYQLSLPEEINFRKSFKSLGANKTGRPPRMLVKTPVSLIAWRDWCREEIYFLLAAQKVTEKVTEVHNYKGLVLDLLANPTPE